jgi:hypothetical protein
VGGSALSKTGSAANGTSAVGEPSGAFEASLGGKDCRTGEDEDVVRGPVYSIFSQQPPHAAMSAVNAAKRTNFEYNRGLTIRLLY